MTLTSLTSEALDLLMALAANGSVDLPTASPLDYPDAVCVMVAEGRPTGHIYVTDAADSVQARAAAMLTDYGRRISGASMPVADLGPKTKLRRGDVVIGRADSTDTAVREDGYRLSVDPSTGVMRILGGPDKGPLYGVVALLEEAMGVDYWAPHEVDFPTSATIALPAMEVVRNPAFTYRQSQNYGLRDDPDYRAFMRLEEPADQFAGGMWVHTFNRLLPADAHGQEHPEWYALVNGQRRPGPAAQWCLSNEEVFQRARAAVDSVFRANPGLDMISVSQNDGNYTWCTCPECAAIDSLEGGHAGPFIRFVNRLADSFPDKQISTLAYLFTMEPPRLTRPRPNVNIMLCDIDAMREVPLTDNASGRQFVDALRRWSAVTDNIFVWDYGINFDGYLTPFPNFPRTMQRNIQLFRDNHARMHFSQIASSRGGDWAELRTYLASRLMMDPDLDADSLMTHFMQGYYGAAAEPLRQYQTLLDGALLGSGKNLWIYDSPVTHADGMLSEPLRRRYNELFDRAEALVADDAVRLDRVRRARLPLQYSELEIARARGGKTPQEMAADMDLFRHRAARYDVPTLNERHNTPQEYCDLYLNRYLPRPDDLPNLAAGAPVRWITPPTQARYVALGDSGALTDGFLGGTSYQESWVGWEGVDGAFVLDLGKPQSFTTVTGDFLHQLGAWVLLPRRLAVSVSTDGKTFRPLGPDAVHDADNDRDVRVKFRPYAVEAPAAVTARYVRVDVEGVKTCPGWHYGVGHPCWFFLDEVKVQ